jgi:hypothetical protein
MPKRASGLCPGGLQPDELGDILQVLAEDVVFALRNHGHVADAQGEQLLPPSGIIQHIDHDMGRCPSAKETLSP